MNQQVIEEFINTTALTKWCFNNHYREIEEAQSFEVAIYLSVLLP
jgi:hypothetical protein